MFYKYKIILPIINDSGVRVGFDNLLTDDDFEAYTLAAERDGEVRVGKFSDVGNLSGVPVLKWSTFERFRDGT